MSSSWNFCEIITLQDKRIKVVVKHTRVLLTLTLFHFHGLVVVVDEHQIGHLLEPVLIQDMILK